MMENWVQDFTKFKPTLSNRHWGKKQSGFNISFSGRVNMVMSDKNQCHRDIIDGQGEDATHLSGIYSYVNNDAILYAYPMLERAMQEDPRVIEGIRSMVGIHLIKKGTKVISNCSRETILTL